MLSWVMLSPNSLRKLSCQRRTSWLANLQENPVRKLDDLAIQSDIPVKGTSEGVKSTSVREVGIRKCRSDQVCERYQQQGVYDLMVYSRVVCADALPPS